MRGCREWGGWGKGLLEGNAGCQPVVLGGQDSPQCRCSNASPGVAHPDILRPARSVPLSPGQRGSLVSDPPASHEPLVMAQLLTLWRPEGGWWRGSPGPGRTTWPLLSLCSKCLNYVRFLGELEERGQRRPGRGTETLQDQAPALLGREGTREGPTCFRATVSFSEPHEKSGDCVKQKQSRDENPKLDLQGTT